MRPTARCLFRFVLALSAASLGGCVTAHEAQTTLEILDNTTRRPIDDCLLLTIRLESIEPQGYWWVAQEEQAGHMVPREASLSAVNSGDVLEQKGKVVVTIGPYVRGRSLGVEYWLFRPGYQPDDFRNDHVESAHESRTPLAIRLLPEDAGSTISDEKILDGARRVLEILDFLDANNPEGTRLLTLLIEQVRRVREESYNPKWQKQSRELLPRLEKELRRFPPVAVTWKGLPAGDQTAQARPCASRPAERPVPVVSAPVEPPPAEEPAAAPPSATKTEETSPPATDLPAAPADESPSPQLIPVDLSELDSPSPETRPAEPPAEGGAVQHDLQPIRKKTSPP